MIHKESPIKKSITPAIVFAILSVMILSSIILFIAAYRQLNQNIQKERADYVGEISQQLHSNIASVRSTYLQLTALLADNLSYIQPDSFEKCGQLFQNYLKDGGSSIFFVTADGTLLTAEGAVKGIDNRDYIHQVLRRDTYSAFERVGIDHEYWLFSSLLSKPCVVDQREIRAVVLGREKEAYSSEMTLSVFNGLGYSFLVSPNGAITVAPQAVDQSRVGYNILSTLEDEGLDANVYTQIENDLKNGTDRSLVCTLGDIQWLLQYNRLSEGSFTFIMVPLSLTAAGTYDGMTATMLTGLSVIFSLALLVIFMILTSTRKERQRQREMYEINLAKKAVEAKNDFLAKMSHDIRTPLNGIIGMNYIASTQIGPDNKEAQASLNKIETSSKYLLSIINDILDMSKIESGKMQLSNKAFSLEDLLENIRNMLEITAAQKQLPFQTVFDLPSGGNYLGDSLRINQILMNLLSNAFKFTERGSVSLSVSAKRLDDARDAVTMVVADTGIGMSQEYLKNAFMPFLQENAETAGNYGGSGLGLAIVRSLVDLMGGELSVKSQKGAGTTFTIVLPLERAQKAEAPAPQPEPPETRDFKGKRVLVTEDNALNAEITIEILKMQGLEADWAQNGKEALEMLEDSESGHYSLILMDIHMPIMDGLAAARAIRASHHPDAGIPICAMSANAFDEDAAASREAGMNEHLKKPVEIDKLGEALMKYIQ